MLVLKTSPPCLPKIHSVCTRSQCTVHTKRSHPVGGNGVTERNSFPSKSREETRLQTLDEALGSQPGRGHGSRCGWCLHKAISHTGMSQPPGSEGADTRSSSPASLLLVWWHQELPTGTMAGRNSVFTVSSCPNTAMYFTFTISSPHDTHTHTL